ncbi:TIGR02569 family protein [Corynebacterium choanae]|uniref:TIGR02569 family protein n=1 Tax=Corynebacterium choanae TaxID=1862358 RepID=A0A3G6J4I4_9CORY|nr:TIGR02569 family protein [Corynebacterium choanae]AZA12937.1 hypothetical protein CCHOA_02600 [Corynebacterium choanae]
MSVIVPSAVASAFRVDPAHQRQLGIAWDYGVQAGPVVVQPLRDDSRALIAAQIRAELECDALRISTPIRATNGLYHVAGWRASRYLPGDVLTNVDAVVQAAILLDSALGEVAGALPKGTGIDRSRADAVFLVADQLAWRLEQQLDARLHTFAAVSEQLPGETVALIDQLAAAMQPIDRPAQIVHGDMLHTTVFAPRQRPGITTIYPLFHPAGYSAAVAIVDGLVQGIVDPGIIDRFSTIPDLDKLLVRAVAYRLLISQLLSITDARIRGRLTAAATIVLQQVG